MAKMDTWIDRMVEDMGIRKKNEGGGNNDITLSDADVDKVADKVIKKLSEEPEISTPKPKTKEKQKSEPQPGKVDNLEEGEISLEEEQ